MLSAIELNGAGDCAPGIVHRMQSVRWVGDEDRLQRTVEAADAWSLPAEGGDSGRDGSRWIVELKDGGRYRVLDRWTPGGGPARQLGLAFLALARWRFPAGDMY
jgi:hypothetical protein